MKAANVFGDSWEEMQRMNDVTVDISSLENVLAGMGMKLAELEQNHEELNRKYTQLLECYIELSKRRS